MSQANSNQNQQTNNFYTDHEAVAKVYTAEFHEYHGQYMTWWATEAGKARGEQKVEEKESNYSVDLIQKMKNYLLVMLGSVLGEVHLRNISLIAIKNTLNLSKLKKILILAN